MKHSMLWTYICSKYSACPGKEMDIFFLLDSSTSIWVVHHLEHLKFVRDLVQRLDVSSAYTRVGVLSFSDKPKNPSVLRLTGSRNVVEEINIDNLPYLTGLTYTDKAIRYVRQLSVFRTNTVKVMVVLTDGESRDRAATIKEAKLARRAGFYIFVVGIGIYTNAQEWRAIANDPDESFMWNLTNYQNLSNVANDLLHRVCYLAAINNTNLSKPHPERTKAELVKKRSAYVKDYYKKQKKILKKTKSGQAANKKIKWPLFDAMFSSKNSLSANLANYDIYELSNKISPQTIILVSTGKSDHLDSVAKALNVSNLHVEKFRPEIPIDEQHDTLAKIMKHICKGITEKYKFKHPRPN
ncbi:collagen alpha-1(xii) chain [Plakobranchus ocellatus]|uniref:Collagen alpha-1(Xii) chain n=1 Tax=Plakobranchus ocellatus TaxID=259542 RepID=A0AAV3Y7L2_9GAST|nr:collagen alpha-1(xii) chain [Plakobranchus ocellatus]